MFFEIVHVFYFRKLVRNQRIDHFKICKAIERYTADLTGVTHEIDLVRTFYHLSLQKTLLWIHVGQTTCQRKSDRRQKIILIKVMRMCCIKIKTSDARAIFPAKKDDLHILTIF